MPPAMPRLIWIIIDGLAWEVARHSCGFLQSLVAQGRGSVQSLQCELPSLSRPLYETLLTGTSPLEHGILHNGVVRRSRHSSVFSLAREAGLITAAAAYSWFHELYVDAPFHPRQRLLQDGSGAITHGLFYWRDDYPDDHLFADAEGLLQRHQPHFLLVHPMGVDHAGHQAGLDSALYRNAARRMDALLAEYLPGWLAAGHELLITADHGMNVDGSHGGSLSEERTVPLYRFGEQARRHHYPNIKQTELCGLACDLLGLSGHGKPVPLQQTPPTSV